MDKTIQAEGILKCMNDIEEDMDLCEEMHSIAYYINDKPEMINQMFSTIKADRLASLLPPILKDITIDDLKVLCLKELNEMSSKCVLQILKDVMPIKIYNRKRHLSTSETELDVSPVERRKKYKIINETNDSRKQFEVEKDYVTETDSNNFVKCPGIDKNSITKSYCVGVSFIDDMAQRDTININDSIVTSAYYKEMDILELEMRARAIRALLKKQSAEKNVLNRRQIQTPSSEHD